MTPLDLARDALVMCDENSDGQQPDRVVVTLARALIAKHEECERRLELINQLHDHIKETKTELNRLRPVVEAAEFAHNAIVNTFNAIDMGWWSIDHDLSCPEDDTCDCNGGVNGIAGMLNEAATKLKRAIDSLRSHSSGGTSGRNGGEP